MEFFWKNKLVISFSSLRIEEIDDNERRFASKNHVKTSSFSNAVDVLFFDLKRRMN